jgi:hypothetical protein
MKISDLIGQTVNFRIKEVFGTVRAKLIKLDLTNGFATIAFKSFGSMYTMIVPVTAISTKNTDGEMTEIKNGNDVIVTLDTSEVVAKKGTILDISAIGVLVKFGNNVRFLTIDSIKELRVAKEEGDEDSKPVKPAKATAPAGRPAPKPAPAAPKAPARR